METVTLDSSVIIAWLLDDSPTEGEARELVSGLVNTEFTIVAPRYLLLEVINSLFWKKQSKADVRLMLKRIFDLDINWVESEEFDEIRLVEIVYANKLTAYDAYFLLVAEKNKCQLVTYDRALLKAVKKRCVTPKQFLMQVAGN